MTMYQLILVELRGGVGVMEKDKRKWVCYI